MAARPMTAAIVLTASVLPMAEAHAGRLFPGWGRGAARTQADASAQQPEKADPMAEFRPPGAPRVETDRRGYRPGYVSTRPADTLKLVDQALDRSKRRTLTVGPNTPWQILHGTLALRGDFRVRVGRRTMPAIDWLSSGVVHNGQPLIEKTANGGRCHPFTEPYAFEGHTNQFLAILSIAGLTVDHQFRTPAGEIVTMGDMVREAQASIDGHGEMTWTLWFLTHYVEPDAEWENAAGQFWSMERLVQMESREKVEGAPCGGMHRLFALALARNAYLAKHRRLSGVWIEADQKVKRYEQAARALQSRDGSFSNQWYKGRSDPRKLYDLEDRLKKSGHTLEWLMVSVSDKDLYSPWMQKAVQAVARDVTRSLSTEIECGAFYHALDALAFYRMRVTPPAETTPQPPSTSEPQPKTEPKQQLAKSTPKQSDAPSRDAAAVDEAVVSVAPKPPTEEIAVPSVDPTPGGASAESPAPRVAVADTAPSASSDAAADEPDERLEPVEDEDVPMLTRLPEGIDEEAAPLAVREAASADGADETKLDASTSVASDSDAEPDDTPAGDALIVEEADDLPTLAAPAAPSKTSDSATPQPAEVATSDHTAAPPADGSHPIRMPDSDPPKTASVDGSSADTPPPAVPTPVAPEASPPTKTAESDAAVRQLSGDDGLIIEELIMPLSGRSHRPQPLQTPQPSLTPLPGHADRQARPIRPEADPRDRRPIAVEFAVEWEPPLRTR